ncbi:MAG: hypothetical protein ACOVKC_08790, partial [Brevundimonas sp.]
ANREEELALSASELRHRQDVASTYAQIAGINAGLAVSTQRKFEIEEEELTRRQALARDALKRENADAITWDERTKSQAFEKEIAQANLDRAQQEDLARKKHVALVQDQFAVEDAAANTAQDILESTQALARTGFERRKIDRELARMSRENQITELKRVTVANGASETEEEIARARIEGLKTINANNAEEEKRRDTAASISEAGDMISKFASSFSSKTANKISEGFNNVAQAFATGGPIAAMMAAVGELGKAIGGATGAFMEGFGSGGLVGGFLSMSAYKKAKKKAIEKEASEQNIELMKLRGDDAGVLALEREKELKEIKKPNRARQMEIYALQDAAKAKEAADALAATARQLEIRMLEAQGNALGALAMTREDELKALDASLQSRQREIYALEDANKERDRLDEIAKTRRKMDIELLEAQGFAQDALNARRADEIALLDPSLRALQVAINTANDLRGAADKAKDNVDNAKADLVTAYNAEAGAIQATITRLKALAVTLRGFVTGLTTGPLALNNPEQQYKLTKAALIAARSGDGSDIPAAATAFLEASKAFSTDMIAYNEDLAFVKVAVEAAAVDTDRQVTIAEQNLSALNAMVAGLITVNQSVLSVVAAIGGLNFAQAAVTAATAAVTAANDNAALITSPASTASTAFNAANYLARYGDVANWAANDTGAATIGDSVEARAAWHWANYGKNEGRTPYAKGGMFTNGIVSQPTGFDASVMGEDGPEAIMPLVNGPNGLAVRSTGGQGAVVVELRAIREENQAFAIALTKTNAEMARIQRQWNTEGMPAVRA